MAKPNTTTLVSYKWSNNTPTLITNTDKFYIYIPTNDPEKAIVYTIENTTLIKIHDIPKEIKQQLRENKTTTTPQTPTTTEYKTTATTLSSSRETTMQTKTTIASTSPETITQKQTIKTSTSQEPSKTTTTLNTVKTSIPQNIYEQYTLTTIITVILLTIILILYYIKRGKH